MSPEESGEFYQRYLEEVVIPMQQLDGQDYHPAPQILPDTHEGFDENGDYHAIAQQVVSEGIGTAITPYRWASYLQDAVVQYCSTIDYTVGFSERYDIVQDIVTERMEALDSREERLDLEVALQIWFRTYGGRHER